MSSTAGGDFMGRLKVTCCEMLAARGFDAHESDDGVLRGEGNGEKISIHFYTDEPKVGVKYVRQLVDVEKDGVIIVSHEGPTSCTRKTFESAVEFFTIKELLYNVTKHALVPKHEAINELPNDITKEQLPKILRTDPIVRFHAWQIGTVVRITRVFGSHAVEYNYRVVTEAAS